MLMFISTAEVFRTRQAIRDLVEVARLQFQALSRLFVTDVPEAHLTGLIQQNCLIPDGRDRLYSDLLLAAAMPEEDFSAFTVSTAVLLADRLQDGIGVDDLYWNFEAFHEHYALADPPIRAALLNGFRTAHLLKQVNLPFEPNQDICLTRQKEDIVSSLESEGNTEFSRALQTGVSPTQAGLLWENETLPTISPATLAAFRYLYERPISLCPSQPKTAALIPWV